MQLREPQLAEKEWGSHNFEDAPFGPQIAREFDRIDYKSNKLELKPVYSWLNFGS